MEVTHYCSSFERPTDGLTKKLIWTIGELTDGWANQRTDEMSEIVS